MKTNMMKKLLTLTLACAMTLSLAACGSKAESLSLIHIFALARG